MRKKAIKDNNASVLSMYNSSLSFGSIWDSKHNHNRKTKQKNIDPKDYCSIVLLDNLSKVMESIIEKKLIFSRDISQNQDGS